MHDKYDYLVIGSGPGGHVSAIKAAQLGLKTVVVEKDMRMFGGVCLNEGCIPAKSLYHNAKIFNAVKNEPELFGCKNVRPDMALFATKAKDSTARLCKGLEFLFKKNKIDLVEGTARFTDSKTVEVLQKDEKKIQLKADKFLIAVGSGPKEIPGIEVDGETVIVSSHAIRLKDIPESILIIGGGAIGTEFASFFGLMGSNVVIVESEDMLLPGSDRDVSKRMESIFQQKGIDVLTSSKVQELVRNGRKAKVIIDGEKGRKELSCDKVLLAVGRISMTKELGLDTIGVDIDENGFIKVDQNMRTSVNHIFAAGDVVNTPMMAHVAYAEGEKAAVSAGAGSSNDIEYGIVPNVVYTEVQAASIGLTEEAARKQNIEMAVGKHFFKANGKAVISSETDGFIKVIADAINKKIIGVHIVGYEAAELIHEFVVAVKAGITADELGGIVHAHPTFSESVQDACKAVFGEAIHG
ncbi:MAG: dihydrolipoyl dehydrogenase [Candidatus Omnitrophota bacterium]